MTKESRLYLKCFKNPLKRFKMISLDKIRYCGFRGRYRLGYTVSSKKRVQLWNVEDVTTGEDVTREIDRWDWSLFERYCEEIFHYGLS